MLSRRLFLQSLTASLALAGIPISGYTADLPKGNIVVIILEGGMDGLAAVPPIGDPSLIKQEKSCHSTNQSRSTRFLACIHPLAVTQAC